MLLFGKKVQIYTKQTYVVSSVISSSFKNGKANLRLILKQSICLCRKRRLKIHLAIKILARNTGLKNISQNISLFFDYSCFS